MTGPQAQRVAIFGATSAIATAVARLYAGRAGRLVLVGRDAEALGALGADLAVRGAVQVETLRADLADPASLADIADRAWSFYDGLDVVLIAHGSLPDQASVRDDPAAIAEAINLNLISAAGLSAALGARFEAAGSGTLAVITSVAGERGRQSNYVYGAAKGGLQRFLEGLRHRLHPASVQVLDIRPGFVSTPMTAHLAPSGPLWAEPKAVAADIVRAIDQRRAVLHTPWFWMGIMLIVRALPRAVFHRSKL